MLAEPVSTRLEKVKAPVVGATVSTDTVAGEAAVVPALPAASAQLATVKVIVPAAVSAGGVNVAVYTNEFD